MSAYKVTVVPSVCYRVRSTEKNHFAWADVYVREWPRGGSISIQSDFGDFAYSWNSIGPGRFTDFLRSLDFDYFMKKARTADYREFDLGPTVRAIRDDLLETRRRGDLSKEDARMCWTELNDYIGRMSESEFLLRFNETETVALLYGHDASSAPMRTRANACCVRFWQEIWPVLCDAWKVLAAEIAA